MGVAYYYFVACVDCDYYDPHLVTIGQAEEYARGHRHYHPTHDVVVGDWRLRKYPGFQAAGAHA